MRVEVKIDNSCIEPKIIVLTASMTEEVSKIIQKLSDNNPQIITGRQQQGLCRSKQRRISSAAPPV